MLAFIAFALNSAFNTTIPAPPYANNPNIVIPASSALHWYDLNRPHTQYLIYKGPRQRPMADTLAENNPFGPLVQGFPDGYHPNNIRAAYNVVALGSNAIAVVDFGHLATALTDFNAFSSEFGLPQETSTNMMASTNKVFQVVFQHPGVTPPADAGWAGEEALDMEWVHAMAPNAKVYVIESDDGNLEACDAVASAIPGIKEVSNSWIEYDEPNGLGELSLDHYFSQPGVTFFAGSGDDGAIFSGWPSTSPNVVSVGGTSLTMNSLGTAVQQETAWSGSGGGPSRYEPVQAWQSSVPSVSRLTGSFRGTPDLAAVADPNTGVAVILGGVWGVIGGTSLATPVVAGIVNTTGTFYSSSTVEENLIYSLLGTSSFRDITSGVSGNFQATQGWDFVTGCGSPLNLTHPIISTTGEPDQVSSPTGILVSGTLSSLTATDGNDYVVRGVPFPSLGSTADAKTHYTLSLSSQPIVPSQATSAVISITAKASVANVTDEVFIYNVVTKTYDLVATPILASTISTYSVNLTGAQAAKYIDTSGNVNILSRALLPQRSYQGTNSGYLYSVDNIKVQFSFYQQTN